MKTLFLSVLSGFVIFFHSLASGEDVRLFSIGSGDISGNYYPVAKAICDVFNESDDTRRRCSPEPSAGSVYNLIALRDREIEFAIVQSDWLRAAYNGTEVFKGSPPMKDLRIVMPLFPETITVLVGPGKEIRTALDLAGAVVDIGRPASGRNATIQSLLSKLGVGNDFFGNVKELKPSVSISQLCEGRIDAAIFVLGHPSELVRNALRKCRATIIEFAGPRVNTLLAESEDYQRSSINQKLYDVRMEATSSISVMATLVTRSDLENAIVQDLVDAVKMNSAELTEQQTVLQSFSQTIAENAGLGVPKHPVMRGSQ